MTSASDAVRMDEITSSEAAAFQNQIRDALDDLDRTGDTERMAHRIADKHAISGRVVGFRRRGREVLLYRDGTSDVPNVLAVHAVTRDGRVPRRGIVWKSRELDRWLEKHHHYLNWVNPNYLPPGSLLTYRRG